MPDGLSEMRFLAIGHGGINHCTLGYRDPAEFEEDTKIRKVA